MLMQPGLAELALVGGLSGNRGAWFPSGFNAFCADPALQDFALPFTGYLLDGQDGIKREGNRRSLMYL